MSSEDNPNISVITILNGEKDFIPLIKANFNEFNYPKDKLELIIVDDGKNSLIDHFLDDDRYLYLHLNDNEIIKFIDKINFQNDKDEIIKKYQTKILQLPNGFKRDYGVGMSNNDYFFHMDYDTSYNKDSIKRKLKFLKDKHVECVYNSKLLCHDLHLKDYNQLYTTESPVGIYEGTIFHTKRYWSNGGFKWSDLVNEGRFFSDNHGSQRKMDNYYDSVKLLTILNFTQYRPILLDLQKSEFIYEIKQSIIDSIDLNINPIKNKIEQLFSNKEIQVLGIHSEFINSLNDSNYISHNITTKFKQTKLAKQIKNINSEFTVLLFGSKQPAWGIFEEIKFDCIFLETHKNIDQMHSIIQGSKKYDYIFIDGLYINKSIL